MITVVAFAVSVPYLVACHPYYDALLMVEILQRPSHKDIDKRPRLQSSHPIKSFEVNLLEASLQGEYSKKLYGAPGRVPSGNELRIVWLDLLEPYQLSQVAHIGVCKYSSVPSAGSLYFASIDFLRLNENESEKPSCNPRDSLWKHRERSELRPGNSYEWVEVTHCNRKTYCGMIEPRQQKWYYGAPGAGVSINLGNTVFLGYRVTPPGVHGFEFFQAEIQSKLKHYDSVQLVHLEEFSKEWRHEIVFQGSECEPMNHSSPGVKCGRHPYLFECSPEHAPFEYLAQCSSEFSPEISKEVPIQQCD